MNRRLRRLVVWWFGLVGLWLALSADLSWPDVIVAGAAAALVLGAPALSTIPDVKSRRPGWDELAAWWRLIGDWPLLMATLLGGVHGRSVGHVRWLRNSSGRLPGPYLASVGSARVVIATGEDGDLLVHVLEPGGRS